MKMAQGTGVAGRQQLQLPHLRMSLSTVYAWSRILAVYARRNPSHEVRIFYHDRTVQDLRLLVRQSPQLDPNGFEVRVHTADGDSHEAVLLLRLMERAAGPDVHTFLTGDDPAGWFADRGAAGAPSQPAPPASGSCPAASAPPFSDLTKAR